MNAPSNNYYYSTLLGRPPQKVCQYADGFGEAGSSLSINNLIYCSTAEQLVGCRPVEYRTGKKEGKR